MFFASLSCKLQSPRVAGSSLIVELELQVFTDALFNFQKNPPQTKKKKRVAHYNGEAKENYHQLNKTQYVHQQLLEPKSRSKRWVNTELVIVR